jgi:hypothetical protein
VYVLGTGEAAGAAMASQMPDLTSSDAFRRAGAAAFAVAGVGPDDIDHAMLYDATAQLPLMALEDLGSCRTASRVHSSRPATRLSAARCR